MCGVQKGLSVYVQRLFHVMEDADLWIDDIETWYVWGAEGARAISACNLKGANTVDAFNERDTEEV